MAKTATIKARTTEELKSEVDNVLSQLGMTATEAINLYYKQIALRKGLPFDVKIPNAETLEAMKEADSVIKTSPGYDNVDDLMADLNS